ncbi:MAG TPA: extracellular solute-binding protein [Ktedonobacteraceae bacterium]|nr:extracellular solute-binding protein [Ktedonobacteraceae bacterium]
MATPFRYILNRREFLKRATAVGLSASSAAALLEACGSSTTSGNGKVNVNLYHTIPAATETFWKQQLLPQFEKQYPGMNLITYQLGVENPAVIATKIKAGGDTAPDMAWLESGLTGTYVQANLLADVDGWFNSHPTVKQDVFPSLITLSSYQGKVWSFPWMTNNTAMQINLDAFEKAGVPIPSQDPTKTWTWDQFAEACKLVTQKAGMKGFLMNNGGAGWDAWLFHAWLGTNGGTFIDANGNPLFSGNEGAATMTFLQSLVKDGYTAFSAPGMGYDPSGWYSGKAAIMANGPWNFPDLVKFTSFKFTVVPYPVNKQPATNTGGDQLYVFNNDPQKVAYSFDYAQYMLTDDFQTAFNIESGNLPVTQSATSSAAYQAHLKQYPFLNGWVNGVPYGVARSSLPQSSDAQTAFGQKAWDPIILQGADVQQALANAASAVTALKP